MTTKSILCVSVGVPRLPGDWELITAATPAEARRHYKARPCAVGLLIVQESDRSEDLHAFLLDHWAMHWIAVLPPQPAGEYNFRCRTVDEKGIGQPLPRPMRKSGHSAIETVTIRVA